MQPPEYGVEAVVPADRAYSGSRFADVRDAVFGNSYPGIYERDDQMPTYSVRLGRVVRNLLAMGKPYYFQQASERAVDSSADLRWGDDGRGFRRLLHPNGVCLSGTWEITADTPYSGYFRPGSTALLIARYSTCCGETRRGHFRSLALAGKLFPTTDPDHVQPLRTASFFTQQDLGGERTRYINDADLRNAPDATGWRRGNGLAVFALTGAVFKRVDRESSVRQLYEIAELGKPDGERTRAPQFMRLLVAADQPRIPGDELDFRDEIIHQIVDRDSRSPRRTLTFDIEVTDDGRVFGLPGLQRRTFDPWQRIGKMTFVDVVASYNGDFVLHFHHPTWRDDRNDPSTATRSGARRVR
jgi:hypothetical protein